jgi:lysophospholipase L1-like esterase
VHIDEYRANLSKIISFLRTKFPSAHLILLTPTILDSSAWQDHLIQQGDAPTEKQRSEANQRKYAEACKEVGLREGVLTVDQWNAMNDPVSRGEVTTKDVLSDGLHLTSLGYQVCSERDLSHGIGRLIGISGWPRSSTRTSARLSIPTSQSSLRT